MVFRDKSVSVEKASYVITVIARSETLVCRTSATQGQKTVAYAREA